MIGAAVSLPACGRQESYSQDTPDDVVRSLVLMVKNGDARRIDDLIYAESDHMRAVLHHLGELMGELQLLAAAVHQRFPEEVARFRAEAEQAAETGEVRGFSLSLGGGRRRGPPSDDDGSAFRNIASNILADPYGWIDRNADRLGTMRLADDLATVTLDDQPVFPPIGIPLRLDGDRWYIALPTTLPGVSAAMPRTEAEWSIIGSMIRVFRKAVTELAADVKVGNISSIHQLSDKAGEKVIWPALLTWGAYQRELDVRRRRDRLQRQFDKRHRDWARAAREMQWEAPQILATPISTLVPPELDRMSRQNRRPNIETLDDPGFADFLESALKSGGLTISLDRTVPADELRAAVAAWDTERQKVNLSRGR